MSLINSPMIGLLMLLTTGFTKNATVHANPG